MHNRYAFLDGIRGIAAIIVVARHTDIFWNFEIYRSYLAVDLFFILSGFVIAYAYDEKLLKNNLSKIDFIKIRIIRLYPVYIFSLAVAILAYLINRKFYIDSFFTFSILTLPTLLLLPGNFLISTGSLFPINPPYWSLFYELIVNILYAYSRPRLNRYTIATIMLISASVLIYVAFVGGSMNAGFNSKVTSVVVGLSRATFGFFVGYILYKNKIVFLEKLALRVSPWAAIILIIAALISPSVGEANPIIDLLLIGLVFPICVLIASKANDSKHNNILLMLGSISYPIYLLHKPVSDIIVTFREEDVILFAPITGILLIVSLSIASICIEKYYDIPIRRFLSKKIIRKN